jgi:hypothetical protein
MKYLPLSRQGIHANFRAIQDGQREHGQKLLQKHDSKAVILEMKNAEEKKIRAQRNAEKTLRVS